MICSSTKHALGHSGVLLVEAVQLCKKTASSIKGCFEVESEMHPISGSRVP